MITREAQATILQMAKGFPVITVTGPRQSGKSTLVKSCFPQLPYVTLDSFPTMESLRNDPQEFLARHPGGMIIDEAQKFPALFSYIKAVVDREQKPGMFVLTGSQQFNLLSSITESLAGRTGIVHLLPFSISEVKAHGVLPQSLDELILQGLYPPLYDKQLIPEQWLSSYVETYLERDVRSVMNIKDLNVFAKFLRMCAARVGQQLNVTSLANDCAISVHTVNHWLSVLSASYVIFLLQPHFTNFGKRLVKTPKLYFYDTGLASWLLNIQGAGHMAIHPSRGALFENLIIVEMLKHRFNKGIASNIYYWRDSSGMEIDALIDFGTSQLPIEIKSGQTVTGDYFSSLSRWNTLTGNAGPAVLIYGGNESYTQNGITVTPWNSDYSFLA